MRPLRCLLLLIMLFPVVAFAQSKNCKIMHEGRFRYMADDEEVIVVIKDSVMTEYHRDGKYTIKTKIEWLNDCEYNITVIKVTVPHFTLGTGDQVNVKINRIEGQEIFYTLTVKAVSWEGKFVKLE